MAQAGGVSRVGFTGAGLDRADHLRLDASAVAVLRAQPSARMLRLAGFDPILDGEGRLTWEQVSAEGEEIFLGLDGDIPLFAPLASAEPGQRAWAIFRILSEMQATDAAIWGIARSLNEWHGRHPFCSLCGRESVPFRAGWGRKCASCGGEHFPRVDPVVIMLAQHEGKVLLGRQPIYPPGRYSALAGFVEPGESIEEAVARELEEEAGIQVSGVRYVASQPWPFPGQLMIACIADAVSPDIMLDRNELEDAFWAARDEVETALAGDAEARFLAPPPYAIAHSLLSHWARSERLAPASGPA
jgi:NAD+ diphosphatase